MKIIVTGGMGFIGANIVHALHNTYQESAEIVVVDNLTHGEKFINAAGVPLLDYCDKEDFLEKLTNGYWGKIDAILHQGACSSTVEKNGRYLMDNNYQYSRRVLAECVAQKIPLIYASSAAVYGLAEHCVEGDDAKGTMQPLNAYGYSKWLFDQHVRKGWQEKAVSVPVVGLRYFNVYGAREQHKGRMASVAFHLHRQMRAGEPMKLFDGWQGYAAGEQKRDFIHIDDVVAVNLHFLAQMLSGKAATINPTHGGGIFNCGTGVARPFNDIALALSHMESASAAKPMPSQLVQKGQLTYIPFPEDLKGKYQSFTEANLRALREAGFQGEFVDIFEGVRRYWPWLEKHTPLA